MKLIERISLKINERKLDFNQSFNGEIEIINQVYISLERCHNSCISHSARNQLHSTSQSCFNLPFSLLFLICTSMLTHVCT